MRSAQVKKTPPRPIEHQDPRISPVSRFKLKYAAMEGASSRRLAKLVSQLGFADTERSLAPGATSAAPDAGVAREIQHLIDHDSHAERQQMKDITKSELFVP